MTKRKVSRIIVLLYVSVLAVNIAINQPGDRSIIDTEVIQDTWDMLTAFFEQKHEEFVEMCVRQNTEDQMQMLPETVRKAFLEEGTLSYIAPEEVPEYLKDPNDGKYEVAGYYTKSTKTIHVVLSEENMTGGTLLHEMAHYMDHICGNVLSSQTEVAKEEYESSTGAHYLIRLANGYKEKLGSMLDTNTDEYYADMFIVRTKYEDAARRYMPKTCEVLDDLLEQFEEKKSYLK